MDKYEDKMFTLNDLTRLYEQCAKYDERIKNFVEKVSEFV